MDRKTWEEMQKMNRQLENLFSNFGVPRPTLPNNQGRQKKELVKARSAVSNIYQTANTVVAVFELPGTDKKDIELNVTGNAIEVKAVRKISKEMKTKCSHSYCAASSMFYRALPLPAKVIPDKSVATYKDGVLKVAIAKDKPDEKKTLHRVNIE